jgi:hypothetical protein
MVKTNGHEAAGTAVAYGPGADDYTMVCGLTKREHFAAIALQGVIASPDLTSDPFVCAELAVKMADALISALNSKEVK